MAEKELMLKNVRCLYNNLKEVYAPKNVTISNPKYSLTVLISKSDKATIKAIHDFVKESIKESKHNAGIKKIITETYQNTDPQNKGCLLRDGDKLNEYAELKEEKPKKAYKNSYVLKVKRPVSFKTRAMVVDEKNKPIPVEFLDAELQSGYWVNMVLTPYVYTGEMSSVSLTLQAVQRSRKDESLVESESPFDTLDVAVEESTGDSPFTDDEIPL